MSYTADHHDAHEDHGHDDHGPEFLPALNPAPSFWPIMLALIMGLLPGGALVLWWGGPALHLVGWGMIGLGGALAMVPLMGWCHSVIVDKWAGHFGETAQGRDLVLGTKLFFLSEIAIFGSIFAYYFIYRGHAPEWPLPGSPHIHTGLPAIGLLILLTSSVTCEFAHKAIIGGNRGLSKSWLLITMVLGFVFLYIQGWEWGYMINHYGFKISTNTFGTIFYVLTGFHGLHVMTGLIMLFIVYGRMEMGHFSSRRHFSMQAASWYWHLVDVVWIFVFSFVYAI